MMKRLLIASLVLWQCLAAKAATIEANTWLKTSVTGSWSLESWCPHDGGYGGADALVQPGSYMDYELIVPYSLPDGPTAPSASVGCPYGSAWGAALNPYRPSFEFENAQGMCTDSSAGWQLEPTATYGLGIGWVDSMVYIPDENGTVTFTANLSYMIDMVAASPTKTTGAELLAWVAMWGPDPESGLINSLLLEPTDDWVVGNVSPYFYTNANQLLRRITVDPGTLAEALETPEWTVTVDQASEYCVAAGIFVESTPQYVDDLTMYVVPEPAALCLLTLGGLALLRRRR